MDKWLASLKLHTVVATALGIQEENSFAQARTLTRDQIRACLAPIVEGLTDAVHAGVQGLQRQAASTGAELNGKVGRPPIACIF